MSCECGRRTLATPPPNLPAMRSPGAVRAMYESLFDALGDAETELLECVAQDHKVALILSLPDRDEVGGSIFQEWSDDGLLLRYQSFSRVAVPDPQE